MPRLFTALEIPAEAAMSLSFLRGGLPGARFIEPEDYHLTLRFIGDVDTRTADEVVDTLDRLEHSAFTLSLSGLAAFGSKKPHSIYAAANAPPQLFELQASIERALQRIGLPVDPRKFTPHVTVARLRNPKDHDVARYLSSRGNFATVPFAVKRFGLFSAKDSIGGGPYLLEEAFDLPGRAAVAQTGNQLRQNYG